MHGPTNVKFKEVKPLSVLRLQPCLCLSARVNCNGWQGANCQPVALGNTGWKQNYVGNLLKYSVASRTPVRIPPQLNDRHCKYPQISFFSWSEPSTGGAMTLFDASRFNIRLEQLLLLEVTVLFCSTNSHYHHTKSISTTRINNNNLIQ